ncbi:MAG: hemin uptake protein HemP [Planctomycetota bacterium]
MNESLTPSDGVPPNRSLPPRPVRNHGQTNYGGVIPEVDFEQLSRGGQMVHVVLDEKRYELKRTRSGRLVLHK